MINDPGDLEQLKKLDDRRIFYIRFASSPQFRRYQRNFGKKDRLLEIHHFGTSNPWRGRAKAGAQQGRLPRMAKYVGCVVSRNGVGEGYHQQQAGEPHAGEYTLHVWLAKKPRRSGNITSNCDHHGGRTPPCCDACCCRRGARGLLDADIYLTRR